MVVVELRIELTHEELEAIRAGFRVKAEDSTMFAILFGEKLVECSGLDQHGFIHRTNATVVSFG